MSNLWLLTTKNLRLLLRDKWSALIVIFAPLLIMLILGLSFNTSSKYGLNIGIYATSYNEEVNSFVKILEDQEFNIVKYTTSVEDCVKDIKTGVVHTCIQVPESLKVESNTPRQITFYIDPSRINLVWMIQETLKTKFDFKSQEISQGLTQEILSKLAETKGKIGENKAQISALKDKGNFEVASIDAITATLKMVDASLPETVYNSTSVSNATDQIKSAKKKVQDALGIISDAQFADESKDAIETLMTVAQNQLTSAANAAIKDGQLISSLNADLDLTKEKLSYAGRLIVKSNTDMEVVTNSLKESIASMDSLLGTLGEMETTLGGQKVTEAGTIVQPLVTKVEKVGTESTYLNYLFPALLIIVIMFSSLLLGTTLVMMEKNSPAFLRNFFLPIRKATFVISIYLTNLILICIQILIILGLSLLFLEDSLPSLPAVALVLFITASVFTFLGMAIGYIFISEETGVLGSISLGSVMLFLSGVILPIESVSTTVRDITYFNPFVLAEKIIRQLFLFQASLSEVWAELYILIGYAIVLFLLILIMESLLHQRLSHRFMKYFHPKHRQTDKMNKNLVQKK